MRFSPSTLIVGIFAVCLGLLAVYGVKKYMTAPEPPVVEAPKVETLRIPLAASDLPKGRTIAEGDVMTVPMTREQAIQAKIPQIGRAHV